MTKKEILMQPNNLIKSKYNFTTIENKFFYKLLYNAQKQNSKSPLYEVVISTEEIKRFIKRTNDVVYSGINDMLNLFKQSIMEFEYIDEEGNRLIFSSGLVTSSSFNPESQIYEIQIHEILYKYITDFMNMQKEGLGYTALNLSLLFKFRGAYSQRLYTLLRLWSRQDKIIEVRYSVSKLREYLKVSEDVYPAYKNFKQKVINKSIDEINKIGNMRVEIKEEIKRGRKVDEIVFEVTDFEPRKYFDIKKCEVIECDDFKDSKIKETEIVDKDVEIVDMYVPNKQLFTSKTLSNFKKDFSLYNFKDDSIKNKFYEAIGTTLEKDSAEKIYVKSYNYFKKVLENKLNDLKNNDYKKTKFHNFDETFTNYSEDEFENIILESQKNKFGK